MKAAYRKLNDRSHSSSTYHKKDGTPVRAILKRETAKEAAAQKDRMTLETDTFLALPPMDQHEVLVCYLSKQLFSAVANHVEDPDARTKLEAVEARFATFIAASPAVAQLFADTYRMMDNFEEP